MMLNAVKFIMDHNPLKQCHYDGIGLIDQCVLDLTNFTFLIDSEAARRGLWSIAEKEIHAVNESSTVRTLTQIRQHQEKGTAITEKDWETSVHFSNANTKNKALTHMITSLEQQTGKSIICGKKLMTSILRKLTTTVGFDENEILSDIKRAQNKMMDIMINSATKCIQSLHPNCKSTRQLLTGVAALFFPQNSSDQSISH
eukprot:5650176-Ditylum_brightwellii.AAC.1